MSNREKFLKEFKENTRKEFTPDLVYEYSNYLSGHFYQYFDFWWDAEKFDWDYSSKYLAIYCNEYFDKWWDPEKFDWRRSDDLAIHCSERFDRWWDSEKFNWDYSYYLSRYCNEHFDKWWNPDKFDWSFVKYLKSKCDKYFQWKIDGVRLGKINIADLEPKDIAKIKNLGKNE